MATILFILLAAVTLISALLVVLERNPVYSVLYLVLTLLGLALVYATLDAPFLAAIQVIVYAGAIMVLFLFVVMLLDLRRGTAEERLPMQGLMAPSLIGLLLIALGVALSKGQLLAAPVEAAGAPMEGGNTEQIGRVLFGAWMYPLEVASVLLLAAIIGAVVLAKR
jgi:NADH-quinone oxidoreductase subunit J